MEASMSLRKARLIRKEGNQGFALIEVMFAIAILAFGLLGLAALLAQLMGTTTQSRYLGAEVMLASEKLEDLNQLDYASFKAGTAQPFLAPGGDLTTDATGYFDTVKISSRNGMINDLLATGSSPVDMLTFKRRWVIETDTPNVRVERITVIIIPTTGDAKERTATYQASTIRPCDSQTGCL